VLRARRQHDARRTFISLTIADGARKDTLRWVTHGPEGDVVELYTTLPWHTLCEEVARQAWTPVILAGQFEENQPVTRPANDAQRGLRV
jgi:hypothetical protein